MILFRVDNRHLDLMNVSFEVEFISHLFIYVNLSVLSSKCRASEMPQAFAYDVISEAYSKVPLPFSF